MKEIRRIVQMWRTGGGAVLVTLVRARGSSYRRPGARLLLSDARDYAGTISGGCLETEVVRKAVWLVRNGAVVERYSTEFDNAADMPFGLGCGGVVDLLMEPVDTPECRAQMDALEMAIIGEEPTVVTWLPAEGRMMARAVVGSSGEVLFRSEVLTEDMLREAREITRHERVTSEGIFVERLAPPQRLYVLGAGDDAKPLVSMGALLGWTMHVLEGRPQLARADRFPDAESVEVVQPPYATLQNVGRDDAVVLMTHSFEQDRDLLAAVLPRRPRYLGMLGARHRTSLLISETAARLGWSTAECCEHIHAPVGLDLGGDGPEVIALAVIAEIQAVRMGKPAGARKMSAEDVGRYVGEEGAMRYQPMSCRVDVV